MAKAASTTKIQRNASDGRFPTTKKPSGSFSTEIVTKRGNITATQAEKAVREYVRERSEKK